MTSCAAVAEPELLAHHYTEAGETDQGIDQWLKAGQRAAERSANLEAIAHLRRGLELLASLPDTDERARRELALQMTLGMPLIAIEGYSGEVIWLKFWLSGGLVGGSKVAHAFARSCVHLA